MSPLAGSEGITSLEGRESHFDLLARLTHACAVSGDEGEVRRIVLEEISGCVTDVNIDVMGNVLATRRGEGKERLRVLLAAHMDEVGFMLTGDEGDGFFRFGIVGAIDIRYLIGKPVWVGRDHLAGVIGAKPFHLVSDHEGRQPVDIETLRIDLGPFGRDKVKVGDRASLAMEFTRLGPSIRAKALDNRLGVAILIDLLKNAPSHIDLLAAFTVQEEIGLRGAGIAAYTLNPDLALVLDCAPASDFPTWDGKENESYNTKLGNGPAIYVADSSMLSDRRLVKHFTDTALSLQIPYQIAQPGSGLTGAAAIQLQRTGIPSLSISVPARYNHSPAGIARIADWQVTQALVQAALQKISRQVLLAAD